MAPRKGETKNIKQLPIEKYYPLTPEHHYTWEFCKIQFMDAWKKPKGFPGGPVVKNLPSNAGNTGSVPETEIPHATGQLSLHTTTRGVRAPRPPSLRAQLEPTHTRACALQPEKAWAPQREPTQGRPSKPKHKLRRRSSLIGGLQLLEQPEPHKLLKRIPLLGKTPYWWEISGNRTQFWAGQG